MEEPVGSCAKIGRGIGSMMVALAVALVICTPSPMSAAGSSAVGGRGNERGSILSVEPMRLATVLATVSTGKRIRYVSRDSSDRPIVVSGAVLTPKASFLGAHPDGAGKVVAWAHGTAGIADRCAPSTRPNLFPDPAYPNYADTVASYLSRGWTVTATDYPGLGTPGEHPYLVGDSEGRAVIDSVRAARALDGSLSTVWAVAGHSQGGQAALFAGEIADTYGTGLRLAGVVAIAPASNLDIIAQTVPGTPGQGYLAFAVYGLAAVDPAVNPQRILARPALDLAGVLDSGCFNEVLAAYAPLTAEQMVAGGVLPDSFVAKVSRNSPAGQPGTAPIFLVHGGADLTVPPELTELLWQQECAINAVATYYSRYPGQDHDPVLYASQADVVRYLTARFAGQPAPANCP